MPCLGEIADTLHISDDAGQIIHILAVTFGTFMQIPFVDMMAFVTYCIRNIECEVVATFGSGNTKQLPVLLFAKMLFQIHVQSRTTRQMLDITMPVQAEFMDIAAILDGGTERETEICHLTEALLHRRETGDLLAVVGCGIDPDRRVPFEPYLEKTGLDAEALSERINSAFAEVAMAVALADERFRGIYSTGGDITAAMPYRAMTNIIEFIKMLDMVVPGFAANETLLYSPELKFYSNKVKMDSNLDTNIKGLHCLGDSSGWTRGLMMASVMGVLMGRKLAEKEGC